MLEVLLSNDLLLEYSIDRVLEYSSIFALCSKPSVRPGSVNEDQLRLGRKRQVWLLADKHGVCTCVQVKP